MKDVTVILTIWKRDHVEEQIEILLAQTNPPVEIWIYHCCDYLKPNFKLTKHYSKVKYQFNSSDLGYFGRFSLGLHCKTPFLLIMDDDIIPTSNWIENSIKVCSKNNSIISSAGRIIPKDDYVPEIIKDENYLQKFFIGDGDNSINQNFCSKNTLIDFGCNSWFLKPDWLSYFWAIKPYSFETGEDIHLSATCSIGGGIKTLCPFQDGKENCGNLKKNYGFDQLASWKRPGFLDKRREILQYLIDTCGWKPLKWK